jgi:hypothetical protein
MTPSSVRIARLTDAIRSPAAFAHFWGPMAIAFVCLGIWALSPIYPDEIAFRQERGRVFTDGGVIRGLYALCPSNFKPVPLVFEPVAWLLARSMQVLPPTEMRILPFATILAVVFTTLRIAAGNRSPAAGFLVLASFVSIAGSGLIFVRYEFPWELHLLSCLAGVLWLRRRQTGPAGDVTVAIGLISGAAISTWSHIQGLLFLPLTSYLLSRVAVRRFGPLGMIAALIPLALFVSPALTLQHPVCSEHPEIEAFWRNMTISLPDIGPAKLASLTAEGIQKYVGSFLFVEKFPIEFLPGIETHSILIRATNLLVVATVCLVGILALMAPVVVPLCYYDFRKIGTDVASIVFDIKTLDTIVLSVTIIIAAVFTLIYDPLHAFYRNFYINHYIAIAAAIMLSLFGGKLSNHLIRGTSLTIGLALIGSLIVSLFFIIPRLWFGYEGPSLSVFRNWSSVAEDTRALAGQCKMDLSRGRIIVDDLTQAAVFSRPVTFPVTYVHLQAKFIGMSVHDAATSLRPNYAILRCPYFDLLGLAPQEKVGELCCYNFDDDH